MIAAHGHATGGDMKSTILLAGILCAMTATYARASSPYRGGLPGWGPRLGVTMDPDQVHFGVHLDAGSFADRFRFQPNVELGLSDEEDGWVALTDGRLVAARVPRGRLELIEKCGHFPHYEHPAEYLQTLEEFLAASR